MEIQSILIVRYGEIALKGMNKPYFERELLKSVRRVCREIQPIKAEIRPEEDPAQTRHIKTEVSPAEDPAQIRHIKTEVSPAEGDQGPEDQRDQKDVQAPREAALCPAEDPAQTRSAKSTKTIIAEIVDGLIIVRGYPLEKEAELAQKFLRIFGVASVSPAWELPSREQEYINAAAIAWMGKRLEEIKGYGSGVLPWAVKEDNSLVLDGGNPLTFKVFGKRSDKSWPLTSPEIAALAGEAVLEAFGEARVKVNVKNPEIRLHIHLRRRNALLYDDMQKGYGGMPQGTNGKGLVLLSGGIDSPVAAWMMAKRGMLIEAVHFHSYPYTSKRAEEKVKDLANILASYCGRIKVHILNLLPVQEALAETCPEDEMVIHVRRFMMRIAARIAAREACGFLVTGENLGQVASQTAESIIVTNAASPLPVLRPLIALDKVEIIERAKEIGTFETSILPYEDCCKVFVPKHPKTRPVLSEIEASEGLLGAARIVALEEGVLETEEIFYGDGGK